jgi:hypothetical protein
MLHSNKGVSVKLVLSSTTCKITKPVAFVIYDDGDRAKNK